MNILHGPSKVLNDLLTNLNEHGRPMGLSYLDHGFTFSNNQFKFFLVTYVFYATITFTTLADILGDFLGTAHWTTNLGFFIQVRWTSFYTISLFDSYSLLVCCKARCFHWLP